MSLRCKFYHPWNISFSDAAKIQKKFSNLVRLMPLPKISKVAAVDASFSENYVFAVAVTFSFPSLELIEEATASQKILFPYVPGFLSFREGRAVASALERLQSEPDVILFDGQGIAHPRRLGIAAHIGVLFDKPSIGCAKSLLFGKPTGKLGETKGSTIPIKVNGHTIGAVVRTRTGIKPLFVSPGHKATISDSVNLVLRCTKRFRLPEPLRIADKISKSIVKKDFHQ